MRFTTRIPIVLAVLASASGLARAQEVPPPGGEPKPFSIPSSETFTLDNGLGVTLIPYGAIPKVTVRLVVRSGNINETADQIWLADLTGDMMMEGTTHRSGEEIAAEAAAMGGEVDVSVGEDESSVGGSVLSEFATALIELVADITRNPSFPASELDRLKADRVRQVTISRTQPRSIAQERFRALLYGDHPYGRSYPTEAMLQGYLLDQLRGFHQDNFGAARSHIYVAGVFEPEAVRRAIEASLGDWEAGPDPVIRVPSPESRKAVHIVDRPEAVQSTIFMGLPVSNPADPDYIPLLVTNSLLGGSFNSRIIGNIREDKGYSYSPFSQVSTRYRDAYWVEVADVATDVTGPSLKEIFFEIDRLQSEPPTAEELEGIQNYMAGTFVLQNSSRNGIISQLRQLRLHGLPETFLTEYVARVYEVTPEEVSRITRELIDDERMTIVIAGDRAAIEEQVAPYGEIVPATPSLRVE